MTTIVEIKDLRKSYPGGFEALKGVNLEIRQGEILALLGPNGAGKTTLISTICGITTATSGQVSVGGHDTVRDYRAARSLIGLVPQEIHLEPFERVMNTVRFSRGLFGKPRDPAAVEKILRQLSLWDKKDNQIRELSGGMKRRVLIAKALAHDPRYIEEAEAIADRVGVIAGGELMLVEEKDKLMQRMGQKQLEVQLTQPIDAIPESLQSDALTLSADGSALIYTYDTRGERTGITALLAAVQSGRYFCDFGQGRRRMNWTAVRAIYLFEMARFFRTIAQSFLAPVISTSLYFVVFGAAIGSRIQEVEGVSYGAFIVPGLIMLTVITQSISNASFGIYFPKFIGTFSELLAAPIVIGFVGAAATKALIIGAIILVTAFFFVDISILHPFAMLSFLILTTISFALFGFIIGILRSLGLSSGSGRGILSSCKSFRC